MGGLGSHVAEALVGAGHEVTVVDDFSTGPAENLTGLAVRVERRSLQDAAVEALLGVPEFTRMSVHW